jgi:hypothetical protein
MNIIGGAVSDPIKVEAVEAAEHLDPVAYVRADTCDGTADLIAKADAGARLFYALYHHPRFMELFRSDFWSWGMSKAYMSAQGAFLPRYARGGAAMGLTTDPRDPALTHGSDPLDGPEVPQAPVYLVLSDEERKKGFVRPVRYSYWHTVCGAVTSMGPVLAETYARSPKFYGATYCATCRKHRPVGEDGEFYWVNPAHPARLDPDADPKVGT